MKTTVQHFEFEHVVDSGDMDAVVPVTSTRYSLNAFNLKILKPWNFWLDDTGDVSPLKAVMFFSFAKYQIFMLI